MQTSQEMVFHPAMGIGLTAGRLHATSDAAIRVEAIYRREDRQQPCRNRDHRSQDCAHIFQCA